MKSKTSHWRLAELKQQLKEYQQRVERTPKREQELMTLKRDYENTQESYNSLLNRKLEAEIAVNMEKKQKGEQFRIIDRAALPRKPVSPDMRKLFLLSMAAGLGLGGGLIFLLDFLNPSLKQPKDYQIRAGSAGAGNHSKTAKPQRQNIAPAQSGVDRGLTRLCRRPDRRVWPADPQRGGTHDGDGW